MQLSKTIIINCAGMGTRLGFGHTKALLEIGGKPLIYHHLDAVANFEDVRVVVGYDSQELIKVCLKKRKKLIFVFNHEYATTGTLASLSKGAMFGKEMILSLDGDLLVNPSHLKKFLATDTEAIGYTTAYSDEPVYMATNNNNGKLYATRLSRIKSEYEWTGITQIRRQNLRAGTAHMYPMLNKNMPMLALKTEAREIDTPRDLISAMSWARGIFK